MGRVGGPGDCDIRLKSRVMVQVGECRIEEDTFEVPATASEWALLRVEGCRLCGSHVERYRGRFEAKGMITLTGHSGAQPVGIIEDIGAEAAHRWGIRSGDQVPTVGYTRCCADHCSPDPAAPATS